MAKPLSSGLEHLSFSHWALSRISCFGFPIFELYAYYEEVADYNGLMLYDPAI
jgi:hypothetical protein